MSEPLPQCKNPLLGSHPASPSKKYGGYCFDCWNNGVPDFVAELDRLRAENERLKAGLEPTGMKYTCGCPAVMSDTIKAFCQVHCKPLVNTETGGDR